MTSILVKIFALPSVLILSMYFLETVNYGLIWQPIVLAVVLLIVGVGMEYLLLRRGNLWSSVFLDFVVTLFMVWGLSNLFAGAYVTFAGALIVSAVIGVCEYFLHLHLITNRKVAGSPA
ncbi:DUF2512 family protein [Halobacillus sp. Marseille-Q1614]|uniref:DUF2512 family protein n=1 Tax=Halobacillus sp. Marseille-Q1614 TaxID=2709134 RepID=UPI0015712C6A|nr:DUF2512 family protein [Halobacillus sp. Marseille-Q1614]